MNDQRGIISREDLIEIIRIRDEIVSRFKSIDTELVNEKIAALALNGGLRGDELRLSVEKFIMSMHGIKG